MIIDKIIINMLIILSFTLTNRHITITKGIIPKKANIPGKYFWQGTLKDMQNVFKSVR